MTVESGGAGRRASVQVVEFLLGREHYAIDLFDVKEVVECTSITRLPNARTSIRGIIDLRGEITTIVDLKEQMQITTGSDLQDRECRIIVLDDRITRSKIGILVDDVTSVSTFEGDQIDDTTSSMNREGTGILGILKRKVKIQEKETNELIIWINIRTLLGDILSFA